MIIYQSILLGRKILVNEDARRYNVSDRQTDRQTRWLNIILLEHY